MESDARMLGNPDHGDMTSGLTMSTYDIDSSRQWIERNRAALAGLDADPRDENARKVSAGIRNEIARVERLIAQHTRSCDEAEIA